MENTYSYSFDAKKSGHGNLSALNAVFDQFDEMIHKAKEDLENAEKSMEQAKKELGKVFPYEEALKEKNARLTELNIILNVESGAGPMELLHSAKNQDTSPELLRQMAENDSVEIREAVAGNESCPEKALLLRKKVSIAIIGL